MPDPTPGRQLLTRIVETDAFDGVAIDADLLSAGLNSGELIKIALAVEEQLGEALDDDTISLLHTIAGIDQVLRGERHRVGGY